MIGNESLSGRVMSRIWRELLPVVCLVEELRSKSQHRASCPKRLGNEIP
jgi:hypothetical protein